MSHLLLTLQACITCGSRAAIDKVLHAAINEKRAGAGHKRPAIVAAGGAALISLIIDGPCCHLYLIVAACPFLQVTRLHLMMTCTVPPMRAFDISLPSCGVFQTYSNLNELS